MTVLLSNNATSRLVGAVTATQTTIEVADASGFPSPTGGDWFPVTLEKIVDGLYVREIAHCTARAGNVLTVVRAQEGTAGTIFGINDRAESRLTAGALAQIEADAKNHTDNSFSTRTLTAGDGLTGGGTLADNRTFTLGTPSSLNGASTNAVTADSHTHAISLTPADVGSPPNARTITAGNGLSGGGDLTANRTLSLGAPGTLNGGTTNSVTAGSHTHAISSTASRTDSSTTTLLQAAGMNNHRVSGDHDGRYYQKSEFTDQATPNAPMIRNSSGDVWARLFRSSYSPTNSNIAAIYTTRTIGGDYMRPSTPSQVMTAIGATTSVLAGNGLSGGGTLAANRTISMGTPGTLSGTTSNGTTASSHTHAISSTDSRTSSSTATLLNAKAMNDHRTSGDHDSRYMQPGDIGSVVAGGFNYNTLGAYLFAFTASESVLPGDTIAGSQLTPTRASGGQSGWGHAPPGTWRAMGRCGGSTTAERTTVFLRIA